MDKEKIMKEEAERCNDCCEWWHHCNAECCNVFRIAGILVGKGRQYIIRVDPAGRDEDDMEWYFRLHGAKYMKGGTLIITKSLYNIKKHDGYTLFHRPCNLLDGVMCKGHPDRKPNVCKELDKNSADNEKFHITPNCLFKFK